MIDVDGGCLRVTVPLTMANARGLLEAGRAALRPGEQVIDFSAVSEADSSAVAVMLGWLRAANTSQTSIKFSRIPQGVLALAEMYGVSDLLPLA